MSQLLNLRSLVTPKFSAPLVAKLCVSDPKCFEVQECARGSITMTSLVGLGLNTPPGEPQMLSFCLYVCPSLS